jgi:hypothetical protein
MKATSLCPHPFQAFIGAVNVAIVRHARTTEASRKSDPGEAALRISTSTWDNDCHGSSKQESASSPGGTTVPKVSH